ncbi:MAG TPA: ParB/RepB/Spo0J family partition protein [Candidatus Acidoferrales bacterium]|nr:ParB/RepB/Spo0J family partition protein [Candidatus Acidoferrales bacterium]
MESQLAMSETDHVLEIETALLEPPSCILRPLSEETVMELMRSIKTTGLLQPIMVREANRGYQIVFGSHRVEACRRLGKKTIPAILKRLTDDEAFLVRITENLLRNVQMNPVQEARGYSVLVKNGWTINAIAGKIGKCDSYVCERLALLDRLDAQLLNQVAHGSRHLTPSHAELLSRIQDKRQQTELAKLIESRRLSVRAVENLINGIPLPTKVQIVDESGASCIHIPPSFVKSLRLRPGQNLILSARGRKLVLDTRSNSRKGSRNYVSSAKTIDAMQPMIDIAA